MWSEGCVTGDTKEQAKQLLGRRRLVTVLKEKNQGKTAQIVQTKKIRKPRKNLEEVLKLQNGI